MIGRVKWFNNAKGFGFIVCEGKEDIFIHYSEIKVDGFKTLKENQLVKFELIETGKGYQAKNVELVEEKVSVN